jgi:predicted phosphodiesterase
MIHRIACFGGIYNNYLALEAAISDAQARGVEAMFCLGDMGAFGPHPDRVFPLLHQHNVACVQGNYDDSIGNALDDCQCGYTDPRDNLFAQLSYDYTLANTSNENRAFLRGLPTELRYRLGSFDLLLCHGSPRRTNEFLWESTCSTHFLSSLATAHHADVIAATHTGMKWHRRLGEGRHFVNVGALGRPENDGANHVFYALLEEKKGKFRVEFAPVHYNYQRLATEMAAERLPEEFIEAILTGWWTTCLEVLPSKERRCGKH